MTPNNNGENRIWTYAILSDANSLANCPLKPDLSIPPKQALVDSNDCLRFWRPLFYHWTKDSWHESKVSLSLICGVLHHHRLHQTPTLPYVYGFILVITNIFLCVISQIILVNILGLVSQDLPTLNTTNYNTRVLQWDFHLRIPHGRWLLTVLGGILKKLKH